MDITVRHLSFFVAIAAHRSFTKAAEALEMTQPPLSMAINQLEGKLGVRLLDRTSHGVELTSAGRHLQQVAYRVLGDLSQAEGYLKSMGEGSRGSITVSAVPTAMWGRLATVLYEFAESHPRVSQKFEDLPPYHVLSRIYDRSADLGFLGVQTSTPVEEFLGADTVHHVWETVELRAVLPRDIAPDIPQGNPVSLGFLDGQTWLVPRRTIEMSSLPEIVGQIRQRHGIEPRRIHTVETVYTCLPLIAAGLGVAILPESVADIRVPNLKSHRLVESVPTMDTIAVWSAGNNNPVLREFLSQYCGQ